MKNLLLAPERRKAIAYVSVGMNISVNPTKDATNADGSTPTNFEDRGGLRAQMLDIFRQAQRANVNVYSIDPSGLGGVVDEGVAVLADIGSVSNTGLDLKQEFLRTLAENTGGLEIGKMEDFASGLDHMFGENASYYLLGDESPNVRPDGKFHKIDVNVSRPGVTVRARRGFFDPRDTKAARNDGVSSDLAGAVTGLLPIDGVELRVAAAPFWQPGRSEAAVTIALGVRPVIPPGARLVDDVQLIASALDGSGSEEASVRESFHIEGTGGDTSACSLNSSPGSMSSGWRRKAKRN